MPLPAYSADDYLAGLQGLLPQGPAWPRDADAVWTGLLTAWAPTYQRSGAAAVGLVADLFPASTVGFLPEWEATLGLPDGCTPAGQVTAQRQAAVVTRLTARGGQSVPYYEGVCASLGNSATIEEYGLFRVGASAVGDAIAADAWAYAWTVRVQAESLSYFTVGASSVGDPLLSISDGGVACILGRLAPAHTVLTVRYGADGPTNGLPDPPAGNNGTVSQPYYFTLDVSQLDGPSVLAGDNTIRDSIGNPVLDGAGAPLMDSGQ